MRTLFVLATLTAASLVTPAFAQSSCTDDKSGGLEKLQATLGETQQTIRGLCAAGKRDEAQAYANRRHQEMANDPYLKQVQNCSREIAAMMPNLNLENPEVVAKQGKNICDTDMPLAAPKTN